MDRLILSAGPIRSGSTWLFNAARLLLLEVEKNFYAEWVEDLDSLRMASASTVLVKIHGVDEVLAAQADCIITCHRDVRDVALSLVDMGWASLDSAYPMLEEIVGCHSFWSKRSSLDLSYKTIAYKPEQALADVANVLDVNIEQGKIAQLAQLLNRLEVKAKSARGHDAHSLLHENHRQDGRPERWRSQLPADVEVRIVLQQGEWLLKYGYITADEFRRAQVQADLDRQHTAEWRDRATAAETAFAELRDQLALLSEAQSAAREEVRCLEQDKAEWRERAAVSEAALAEVRKQVELVSHALAVALENARRMEKDKADWRDRASGSEKALIELRHQVLQLSEARAVALEEVRRLETGKSDWRDRATAAERAVSDLQQQADHLSRLEAAARDEVLCLEQRGAQLRAEVEEAEKSRAAEAARADAVERGAAETAQEAAKERQARLEAERGIEDSQRRVQALQSALAMAAHGRESAKAALEAAHVKFEEQQARLAALADAARDRDAIEAALDKANAALAAQNAVLAHSRYIRLRSRLLRFFGRGAA